MAGMKPYKICAPISIIIVFLITIAASAAQEAPLRKPVFAGSFYPAEKAVLEKVIDTYLKDPQSKGAAITPSLFGVMVPHAGYEYSGKVAAFAYNQIKGRHYKTVIILGPSHRVAFKGISIYPSGVWETPLGKIPINTEMAQKLMEKCKFIKAFAPAFEQEHSLEVQLPFLQKTLKDFKIVPLVMGDLEAGDYKILSDALSALLQQNENKLLIVASSDMSHYHPYDNALQMDRSTLKEIGNLNTDALIEGLIKGNYELCGSQTVIVMMMVAQKLGGEAKILRYANSGDVTADKSRVVGYGSVAFTLSEKSGLLNSNEQKTLLAIARKTLEEYVSTRNIPQPEVKEKRLLEKRGVFVTLTKKGDLRGCIGYIMPLAPLHKAVVDMTIAASSRDPRFYPVSKEELKDIHIEISVLTPLKLISDIKDIEVGKHGLYIVKGNYSGLLLPQVATSYKWNREEFLKQTCLKAGLPSDTWKEKDVMIYTFSAQIFSE
jgi:hypothetical protein